MVKHVKSIVDHPKENANTGYFKNEKNAKQKNKVIQTRLYETALGMAYGFESEINQNLPKAIDTKDLIEILFHKANIEMEKYEDEDFKAKRALTKEMIKVFDVNDVAGTAKGSIFCCFCEDESYGVVKVFCKSINSISWTLSNYKTHMIRQHEEQYKRAEERLQANGPVKKRKKTKPNIAPKSDQIQPQQELEQIISNQITDQINKVKLSMGLTESFGGLRVLKTPKDANCLYFSLCHQLFQKVEFKMIKEMRLDVVEYIESNFDKYLEVLEKRVQQLKEKKRYAKITPRSFVGNHLNMDVRWN